jgi:hypothetical protein
MSRRRAVRAERWWILAGYGLLIACTQLLWLSYAAITTQAHRAVGVSEGAVGDLAAIFPLVYVLLALPSGRWLDSRFSTALSAGADATQESFVLDERTDLCVEWQRLLWATRRSPGGVVSQIDVSMTITTQYVGDGARARSERCRPIAPADALPRARSAR